MDDSRPDPDDHLPTDAAAPPRPPVATSRRLRLPWSIAWRPSGRVLALAVLLGGLALGSGIALGADPSPPAEPRSRPGSPPTSATVPRAVRSFTAEVGDTKDCQMMAAAEPQLLCAAPEGVATFVEAADLPAAYEQVAGADDGVGARGVAACESGAADERSWARPETPSETAGRYTCRVVQGRAEIWWTVDDAGVLGHAWRRDTDLAALFSWWRSRNEHP